MVSIILFLAYIVSVLFGIYYFDFQVDGLINQPITIALSFVGGIFVVVFLMILYIEILYLFVHKKSIQSMTKHKIAKQMMMFPVNVMNMRVKVVGLENVPQERGFSIYSNHIAMWDIPILMWGLYEYPVAFLAKESVRKVPFLSKWITTIGCVLLDRSNNRKGAESIINVIKNIKNGSTMVIFPEGTRHLDTRKLLPFKDGAFKAALKSKAPLVPVTIVDETGKRIWPMPKRYTIVIHQPIAFADYRQLKTNELSDVVREIIASAL